MSGISLQALCSQMMDEGYNYATFISNLGFLMKYAEVRSPKLNVNPKPGNSLYFSPIVKHSKYGIVPDWYVALEIHDNITQYSKKDITFAKIDFSHIISQSDTGFHTRNGRFVKGMRGNMLLIDWDGVYQEGNRGIHVNDPYHEIWNESAWDCQTVAIWDCRAREGGSKTRSIPFAQSFTNVGDYVYEKSPSEIYPMG